MQGGPQALTWLQVGAQTPDTHLILDGNRGLGYQHGHRPMDSDMASGSRLGPDKCHRDSPWQAGLDLSPFLTSYTSTDPTLSTGQEPICLSLPLIIPYTVIAPDCIFLLPRANYPWQFL